MNATVFGKRCEGETTEIHIPLYVLLEFLDWPSRFKTFEALHALCSDSFEARMSSDWITRRIVAESLFVPLPKREIDRNKILLIGGSVCLGSLRPPKSVKSTSVHDDEGSHAAPPYLTLYINSRSVSGTRHSNRSCNLPPSPLRKKGGASRRWEGPYSNLSQSAKIQVDRVCPISEANTLLDESALQQFVNGSNVGVFLSGHRPLLPKVLYSILDQLSDGVRMASSARAEVLGPRAYECTLEATLYRNSPSGMMREWAASCHSVSLVPYMGEINQFMNSESFVCIQVRQVHFFTKPELGAHENVFTILVEPRAESGCLIAKRDRFVLRRCLEAIQSTRAHVPYRESRLTRFIDLMSMSAYRIVLASHDSQLVSGRGSASLHN
jgi:hypothetical protein